MANHFSILALRIPWIVWKGKKIGHWKMNFPAQYVPNMLLEISGKVTPERMRGQSQIKNSTQLWTGDRSELWCCKEQYCIGSWNVRSMNRGKLEVVKQEMARVNIHILGISEPKRTEMGEFNSDGHYTYYCGQESLRRNGVVVIVNKRVWNAVLGCSLKNDRMISGCFQGKPFNITVIQIYAPISNAEETEVERFYEELTTRSSRINTPKRCSFHYRGLECKSRKSRDTWSNRQIWPWRTEWSRSKTNRVLPRECTGHGKHPLPKTQDSTHMDITT